LPSVRALLFGLLLALVLPAAAHAQQPADDPPTDVLFVLDSSASMSRDDSRGKASDPQALRLSAVRAFITLASGRMRIGLLNLSDALSGNEGLDRPTALETGLVLGLTDASPSGKAQLLQSVNAIKTTHEAGLEDGYTYMSRALDLAGRVMADSRAAQRYVIVLSDGDVTGEDPRGWWAQTTALQASGVKVVVFRLGRREPPGLTNSELASLSEQLAPGGGAARVIDRPEDLLGYYLQTFVALRGDTYVNALGPLPAAEDRLLLDVRDWMDITEIHLLVPGAGVTKLFGEKLGRDVAKEARGDLAGDPNLEILSLSRERIGALEGNWRIGLAGQTGDVQVVFRSKVRIAAEPVLQPKGVELAVVSVRAADGSKPIPGKSVVARGAAGDEATPLLLGALGPDRYSGVVRPDRDGIYRVRVAAGEAALPPHVEKVFPVATTDKIALEDVALTFERVGDEALLKAGQPLRVRVTGQAGRCQIGAAALRVEAAYPSPPPGLPAREPAAAAQPIGPAPTGGLLYGFVPHAPGQVTFAIDHGLVRCGDLEQPVGIPTGGRGTGTQSFDVDVERLLKVDRETKREIGTLAAASESVDVLLKYEIGSWRNERVSLLVEGLPNATTATPSVDVAARDGAGRPRPGVGTVPIKVRFGAPQPGGGKGAFTLVARRVEPNGATTELGRYDFAFDVGPSQVAANVSRDPVVTREGITFTIAFNPARLAVIAPANAQDFELVPVGLQNARIEPRVVRAVPHTQLIEHRVFVQTTEFCDKIGKFDFGIDVKPVASPNGQVLVNGSPVQVSVNLPKMEVSLAAPERLGALRPGVPLPVTLQSTSLCAESLRLKLSEPADPSRFASSGLTAPEFLLAAGDGEIRTVQVAPERPAARGQGGLLRLEAIKEGGHPSTTYPAAIELRYYTPLWTEEFPLRARVAFLLIAAALSLAFSLPRTLFADPIVAHRAGDSSAVSGRKRFRWFVLSTAASLPLSLAIVYWAMARFLP
jgi:hypothetical protein